MRLALIFSNKYGKHYVLFPVGKTASYQQIAQQINKKDGQRAVGMANGKNPIPLVIPCHRVINSNGKLGGYSGALWRKEWLLNMRDNIASALSYQNQICLAIRPTPLNRAKCTLSGGRRKKGYNNFSISLAISKGLSLARNAQSHYLFCLPKT
jgi:O-6-methylguanine DNA methyltransferase